MLLDRVDIKNFRSIEELSLNLTPSCRIRVGINECGKSNILRALALLDPNRVIETDDIREPRPDDGLASPGSSVTDLKGTLAALKNEVFVNLKPNHIEDTYYEILDKLAPILANALNHSAE